ncbi:MAG: hypothetical protein R2879_03635 [Saprospiraceae bacterium]
MKLSKEENERLAELEKEKKALLKIYEEQKVEIIYMTKLLELIKEKYGDDFLKPNP